MKIDTILSFLIVLFSASVFCQSNAVPSGGGEYTFEFGECISSEQSTLIKKELKGQMKKLNLLGKPFLNRSAGSFILPIKASDEIEGEGFMGISNFVDHDALFSESHNDLVEDYNCGVRSYDTGSGYNHKGTDYFTWPFTWRKMDQNLVHVVAAMNGTIILKSDGNYDRNCSFCTNCNWNAVYLLHDDGTVGWYGHLKNESLLTKVEGENVVQGELLGVVGSSGNSTGPHLHFEVYENSTLSSLIDPYEGNCNPTSNESKFIDQEPYYISGVNKITVGKTNPFPGGCGEYWAENSAVQFDSGQNITCTAYYRDQLLGGTANYRITRPDGVILHNWQQTFTQAYNASFWFFNRSIPSNAPNGVYTFEVRYGGDIKQIKFNVGEVTSTSVFDQNEINIYPNPTADICMVEFLKDEGQVSEIQLINNMGQNFSVTWKENDSIIQCDLKSLPSGIYLLHVTLNNGRAIIGRIVRS